jgi:3-hydroxybutyryl-CoA dehydrogenase
VSQPSPNERLGIVGSGAIATGLARLAGARFDVILRARSDASAQRAAAVVEDLATVVTDLDALCETTIVVEAIAEDHAVKCELHGVLGELLPAEVPVSSTTSSLSAQALADASGRPELFAAAHFFNPVEKMPLVELAFPREATDDTRARWLGLCEALDKTVVEVPDSPGFVVNRLLFPYLFEAVRLQQDQGLDAEAVDTCMKLGAGHPMGPLKLLDFVGLDVSAAIADSIGVEVPDLVRQMIADGRLGRKTGAGFYTYEPKPAQASA